ncbi:MAG: DegQ family serine endoprotease [Rhodospirillales bacterium]|nr:DegQ family serine endoprotease [Rhodospirillales bacterium]MCW8862777.1 DegQ family serine endoprotease [Rhodospirillales bacterium]MCW8952096.1 DegQ family serine endoprotease [Rhodospirillales bacterium]MCW9002922.1 DegQ family serine endoprotease [Rhodospirillales bacterium]MCW9040038.1 DegQ family serine endoprotease [Rhodospirillales bacterium]
MQAFKNYNRLYSRSRQTAQVGHAITRERAHHGMLVWITTAMVVAAVMLASTLAQARPVPNGFSDLAEKLIPSVVTISSTTQMAPGPQGPHGQQGPQGGPEGFQFPPGSPFEEFFKDFFERNQTPQRRQRPVSLGSGFIIDAKGYVVTNNHVIADSDEITVVMNDDTMFKAELVGRDPDTDIAVLKIDVGDRKLVPMKFGDSDKARVGEWVLAIGNPFGLGSTVTAGIISARGRDINAGRYDDFIQTDAPINKGNSGGPLFNMDGEVIGVNTLIYSMSGGSVGIGFSVPAAVAQPIVNQLIEEGRVRRGWLGVRIQTVTDEIAESLGLAKAQGALVAGVADDSPAAKAGLKPGDVILEFNKRAITEMRKLPRIVAETKIGEPATVKVWRDGKEASLKVTVGELSEEKVAAIAPSQKGSPARTEKTVDALGLTVSGVTTELRERFGLSEEADGVVIIEVNGEGPAAEKGIRPGDLIVEIGQEKVAAIADVEARIEKARKAGLKSVLLLIEGQGGLRFVALRLAKG